MKIKKLLSLMCSFSILVSSLFCCKAEIPEIKVAVFGEAMVGKTQILNRLINNTFNEVYRPTIGLDYKSKTIPPYNRNLAFWDTSGQERFRLLLPQRFCNTSIGIFVCSEDNQESVDAADSWLQFYTKYSKNNSRNVIIVLNKCDLKKDDSECENIRQTLINNLEKIGFSPEKAKGRVINVSAKNNIGIEELNNCLIQQATLIINRQEKLGQKGLERSEQAKLEQERLKQERLERKRKFKKGMGITGLISVTAGGAYALYKKYISKNILNHKSSVSNDNVDFISN